MNCAAGSFLQQGESFQSLCVGLGDALLLLRCSKDASWERRRGEEHTLETQSLTLTQAALQEATVCSVVFQRCNPILFFLFFLYDHLCDWELEEIEPGSLLTGLVSCPHPWRGGAGLGQQ